MDTSRDSFDPDQAIGLILDHIRRDEATGRFDLWGTSTVIDENVGAPLFDRDLFDQLHEAAGIDATFPVGNAGVIHVYGYWFSTVKTPYGLKRDRWQEPDLARALGLAPNAFHLNSSTDTTPLERLSDVALPLLQNPLNGATVVDAPLGSRHENRLSRVVLVQPPGIQVPALIYGISPAGTPPKATSLNLVTVFPLQGDWAPLLKDFSHNPRPRWNAVISPLE